MTDLYPEVAGVNLLKLCVFSLPLVVLTFEN